MSEITEPTQWFTDAVNAPHQDVYADIKGSKVHYLAWGAPTKQGVILVHGNGAHARWFQFIGPLLADDYHVASLDLSGMGDSAWRDNYVRETFADDIWGVCEHAGMQRPIIAAHSFGGLVGMIAAHQHSQNMNGMVYMDYVPLPPERHVEW
ncbi:MAG: alpha/beta hydrolase, partial [Pseudomonadota bacterium]